MRIAPIVFAFLLAPVHAYAVECATDADCGAGEMCVPNPCPACPEGVDCPCDGGGTCMGDVPEADCQSDADCPTGFRCATYEAQACSGGGVPTPCTCACPTCPPGETCEPCECPPCETPPPDPMPPEECTTETLRVCEFAPEECSSDADCDEGFECAAVEECTSVGCGCVACACPPCQSGEECPPCDCPEDPPPCECEDTPPECEVLGHYCTPKAIACETDEDCPADWTCASGDCPVPLCDCPQGNPDCTCGTPVECDRQCMPARWADYGMRTPAEAADATERAAGATGGTTGTPKGGTDGDLGAQPPATPGAQGESGHMGETTGCTAGAAPASPLLLLSLALLLRRRRS